MAEVLSIDGHSDKSLAVLLFTNVQNSRSSHAAIMLTAILFILSCN